jgi:hypothetical protein
VLHHKYIISFFKRGLALASLFWLSCGNPKTDIEEIVTKDLLKVDKAYNVEILYSERSKVVAKMYASEFIRNESRQPPFTDVKKGLKVEFFDDSLKVKTVLTSKEARYYESEGNVVVSDSVVVKNEKDEVLETEELVWNQTIKMYYTDKFVKVTTPQQIIYGRGLEANEDFSWYQIHNIRGTVLVDKKEVPQ